MKISIFLLVLCDIDFFDPILEKDTPFYIDSYYLTWSPNKYVQTALETQKVFMTELMEALKNKDEKKLLNYVFISLNLNLQG